MTTTIDKPKVLIVGAGLGGLMLGALLEKVGIPYTIFERTTTVKPLGSAMFIAAPMLTLLAQLEILNEFVAISKELSTYSTNREVEGPFSTLDYSTMEAITGYPGYIVSRPIFYDLLLKQIPTNKILFGRRVINILEKESKVMVQTADNRIFEGDILVGADGAYSTVRQSMFETLKQQARLPKTDQEDLPFSCTCLIGQTRPLNPEEFPVLKEDRSRFAWMVLHHLEKSTSRAAMEQKFKSNDNSEWTNNTAAAICAETRDIVLPIVGLGENGNSNRTLTIGDLIDRTDREFISKVMLEEKIFSTWSSGRTVLLGDACHKLHPAAGQGAVNAVQDAVVLANLIYTLPSTSSSDITTMFKEYQDERMGPVQACFKNSQISSKMMAKGFSGALARFIFGHMPDWLWRLKLIAASRYAPSVGFLKRPEVKKGAVVPDESSSADKARALFEKRQAAVV
ncbi:hypothetical protein BG015_010427 [Linnemannia schmuckeri]|uniref:FAD-binding domain-containing protein n=1 Tax=Linnemannia schmuckeri TaxID=64567 RepID=A0A9P5RWI4_9FUNG|nr:hypothetical protein BG015_010427 [Linnemannia schmuckeri]